MDKSLSRRQILISLAGSAALAGTSGCVSTNAASGRDSFTGLQSINDDIAEGRRNHPKILKSFGGAYLNQRLADYVKTIGLRLAQQTEYQQYPFNFTILNTPIVNAFALPGGYIYITRGLLALASNEAELASVLSHELAHVTARHGAERRSAQQVAQIGLLLGAVGLRAAGLPSDLLDIGQTVALAAIQAYSREHEFEADTLGIRYMSRAGYNADAMTSFLGSLREHSQIEARTLGLPAGTLDEFNIMSTHPRTVDRVKQAQKAALKESARGHWAADRYLNNIDGMMFGDDPKQGVIRGQKFIHPLLRFEFEAPTDFILRNSPARVQGNHPSGARMVFDMAPSKRAPTALTYLQEVWASRIPLRNSENIVIDGLEAATGWVEGRGKRGPIIMRLLVIRRDSKMFYRFMYMSPKDESKIWLKSFRRSGRSFRRLDVASAAKVIASRLLIVSAQIDENIAALARALPYGRYNEKWFRVLNNLKAEQVIKQGQRLKIVAH